MQAHGLAPGLEGPLVGRFHDAGAAAGDDAEARVHQHAGDFFGILVFLHVRRAAGRTENGDAVDLQGIELVQSVHHFRHDPESAPGFGGHGAQVIHYVLS